MTATKVDGRTVIEDQPALAPVKTWAGAPVYYKQIRELLLDDGTSVFGCAHCDYTGSSPVQVRPHLNKHRDIKAKADEAKTDAGKPTTELSLAQILDRIATLDRVTADRDQWKARALKAEGSLKVLRDALGGSR